MKRQRCQTTGQKWAVKKTEKIATKKRKQDQTEVSFRMTIFLFGAVLKEICNETLILVYV